MVPKNPEQTPVDLSGFKVHTKKSAAAARSVRREPPGAKVSKTGRTVLNAEGSQGVLQIVARKGWEPAGCGILWSSNEKTGQVAGQVVLPDTEGATPIRVNPASGVVTLYMAPVFVDSVELRPVTSSWVAMTEQGEGESAFFVIHMNLGLVRKKSPAKAKK